MSVRDIIQTAAGAAGDNAWDVSKASYTGKSFNTGYTTVHAIYFKPDGTRMYVGERANRLILQYNLSVPWDVTSATYSGYNFSYTQIFSYDIAGVTVVPPTGTNAGRYLTMVFGPNTRKEYMRSFSTGWELTGGVASGGDLGLNTSPTAMAWASNGTRWYVAISGTADIQTYGNGSLWYASNHSRITAQTLYVGGYESSATGIFSSTDGKKMFVVGSQKNEVITYNSNTAYLIAGATLGEVFSIAAQTTSPTDLYFDPDGTRFYVSSLSTVYQYEIT